MLCQICNVNAAEVKLTQIINSKKLEMNLCKKCAEEKGIDNPLTALPQIFGSFLMSMLDEDIIKRRKVKSKIKCRGCGLVWDDFQKTGLFGCDICYDTFREDLKVILRRIHGSNQHIGSRPKTHRYVVQESDLKRIKLELQNAIENENFERAAELRDMIRDAQREIDKKENDGILR
ncbi:MAG: UvrB/UvrC motif-containing protein [bacterium]